jgi:hypothetical protein
MKIAFTSCMDATRVPIQPVWEEILDRKPDVVMLLGDQIYMDWGDLGASNWKKLIGRNGKDGLRKFAEDMHYRYEAQTQVKAFMGLMAYLKTSGKQLLMTWDDHDFAWNNSLGAGPDDGKHWVPKEVKAISLALFRAFEKHLRNPAGSFPDLDTVLSGMDPHPKDGIQTTGVLQAGAAAVPYQLLDTRWYRTARNIATADCSILGTVQEKTLLHEAGKSEGLLLVAGGTPLKYKYLISDQDWESGDDGTYPEYSSLLSGAERPVLYLSGDVHRNSWGGRVNLPGHIKSQVIQVLSSGAAIPNYGPKRFAASFGWLEIAKSGSHTGEVIGVLVSHDPKRGWIDDALPLMAYTAQGWTGDLEGEAGAGHPALAPGMPPDTAPLTVFTMRRRLARQQDADPVRASLEDLTPIDDVYAAGPVKDHATVPEPILVSVAPNEVSCRLQRLPNSEGRAPRMEEIQALMLHTFRVARDQGKKSVALFVHGLGKSPSAAIDQGYSFRASFADCEPMIFSWPTGDGDGAFSAYFGYFNTLKAATMQRGGLSTVLTSFGDISSMDEFDGMTKVIVARSLGTVALGECFAGASSNYNALFKKVSRIVLSAPAIKKKDFAREHGIPPSFHGIECPIYVTVNREDQALKFADWTDGRGQILGLDDPQKGPFHAAAIYLDFTYSRGVGRLHDYLIPRINPQQIKVNESLIYDASFDTSLVTAFSDGNFKFCKVP